MDWSAIAIIVATFAGPIAAVQIQKYLERHQERERAKREAFRTLMATRHSGNRTSPEHVSALNGIEITFDGESPKDRAVREAWNAYRDLLNTQETPDANANERLYERRDDAFWDFLYQMARAVGYSHDRTYLKNSTYSPIAHGNLWRDQETIRRGLSAVLAGKAGLPVVTYQHGQFPIPQSSEVPDKQMTKEAG